MDCNTAVNTSSNDAIGMFVGEGGSAGGYGRG